jgi:hypothetical protein
MAGDLKLEALEVPGVPAEGFAVERNLGEIIDALEHQPNVLLGFERARPVKGAPELHAAGESFQRRPLPGSGNFHAAGGWAGSPFRTDAAGIDHGARDRFILPGATKPNAMGVHLTPRRRRTIAGAAA